MSTIGLIHSTRLVIDAVHKSISEGNRDLDMINLLDEGLLRCLHKNQSDRISRRMIKMAENLREDGADLIIVTCSSLSPYVNEIRKNIDIPIIKIDEPMIEWVVDNYSKIGVIMTNPTTVEPTTGLIEEVAGRLNKQVSVSINLCAEAFDLLNRGDQKGHDDSVVDAVQNLMSKVDVVILAQISIARVIKLVNIKVRDRVLSGLNFIGSTLPD